MTKGKDTKPHVGIFGRRNNGKSSLINAMAGHDIAIVSELAGTTTDPVKKSIELPGIGPAVLIDTAGIDDSGELGMKRVASTMSVVKTIDFAVLVIAGNTFGDYEINIIKTFKDNKIPFLIIHNKSDLNPITDDLQNIIQEISGQKAFNFSVTANPDPASIISLISANMPESAYKSGSLIGDLISTGDLVLLITPIDTEAPEGRMILPQVQVIRDVLDNDCIVVVAKEDQIEPLISQLNPRPKIAITDSQVFKKANEIIPKEIPLTSFSIVLARGKGNFEAYIKGTPAIETLRENDRILILESCTHHVTCDDIGRNKIPDWLNKYTGKNLHYDIVAGMSEPPLDIKHYSLVIQCGGCVLTKKQVYGRTINAVEAGIPVTNYGLAIAWIHGIFHRATEPFIRNK